MKSLRYAFRLCVISVGVYIIGRIFPRKWIKYEKFPFKDYKSEQKGLIYRKIKVEKWKKIYPDASLLMHKICKRIPEKRVREISVCQFKTLIYESCVAEMTHAAAILLALVAAISNWSEPVAVLLALYVILAAPSIVIQRYNRPKYIRAYNLCVIREATKV